MLEDTIIAISTPLGYGGLGIVRLSGKKSLPIAKKIFKPKQPKARIQPRRPLLGQVYNFEQKQSFEEAYLTYFLRPHTYTKEDIIEISCHGSPLILEEIVRLGVKAGARHAHPGEFTLRAFLNGRIDILQAEAVNDLIQSSSLKQAQISYQQLEGSLSKKIVDLRKKIIHLLSQIEASLEFPDEGLRINQKQIFNSFSSIIKSLEQLIDSYKLGKTLSEGLSLAIAGRPNVGKSTLFNALLQTERAIVTPYPGTTRDYLQELLKIKNSLFTLIDMAGLSSRSHPVEKEGIERGHKLTAEADGVLLLFDLSRREAREDFRLLNEYRNKNLLLLFNKADLPRKMNVSALRKTGKSFPSLEISALKGTNLGKLKDMIHRHFVPSQDVQEEVILHLRQKLLLEEILTYMEEAQRLLVEGYSEDLAAEELREIYPLIGQLTGEIRADEVIEDIFSRFCVGK
jgi:tRNA modification GTPase